MKRKKHDLAGKLIKLNIKHDGRVLPGGAQPKDGDHFLVEDWWDNISDTPWGFCEGNPACLNYAFRGGTGGLPTDDEVVYGKIGLLGHLIHVSELGDETQEIA